MPYDLFVSYSRKDNRAGRVTELIDRLSTDYLGFAGEKLGCFFDLTEIDAMHDWHDRILGGLRESNLLLLVLSPAYLESQHCEWEIVEFLKYEHARAVQGQAIAQIYFVEVPGLDSPEFETRAKAWVAQIRRRNHCDLRSWFDEGAAALERADVRARLDDLERSLHARLTRLRRLAAAPGNLPAHNPRFVGRETEMQLLHRSAGRGRLGVLTAVHGVGGLGKTALAIQYAYAFADFYPGGRWLIGCAGRTSLASALRSLDLDLGVTLDEDEKRDDTRAAKRVLRELRERAERGAAARAGEAEPPAPCALLLLDNVDSPDLIQPPESDLLTGLTWLHVVVTTRLGAEQLGADPERHQLLAVDELPAADALRLIESYQPGARFPDAAERAAAADLVALLSGFTLAVEVVAVYLGESRGRITCAAFLERLRAEGVAGLDAAAGVTRRGIPHGQKLLSLTLAPTLETLSAAEKLVLSLAALLPPESVPLPWLRAVAAEDYPELGQDAAPGYDDPWLGLVNHFLSLRLLQVMDLADDERTPRVCRMHRVVQECVKQRLGATTAELENRLIDYAFTRSEHLDGHWHEAGYRWEIVSVVALLQQLLALGHREAPRLSKWIYQWLPHYDRGPGVERMLRRTLEIQEADPSAVATDVAITLSNLGGVLLHRGRFREAESCLKRALDLDRRHRAATHPFMAIRLNNLAQSLEHQGRLGEAEPLHRESLEIARHALPAGHLDIAVSLNGLAGLLRAQGRLGEAEPLHRESLEIRRHALPAGHPGIARILNNLALVLQDQGRCDEAEPLLREALEMRRQALPAGHPDIAATLNNLASLLRDQGKLGEAEPLHREALAMSRQALPAGHPDIATSLGNLAALLQDQGKLGEAEPLHREALAIRQQALPAGHPDIATSLNNLASLLQNQGKLGEAEPLHREALAIRREGLSPGHPGIASSLNNLATVLHDQGKLEEAEPLYREALAIRQQALPAGHPDTATSLNNLAGLLRDQGKLGEAEPLCREALAITREALPPWHPYIATGLNNLAGLLRDQGKLGEAESLHREALAIWRQALPAGHPDIATSLNNLASLLQDQGKLGEAEPLYREALAIRQQALPAGHPDIATSLNNLAGLLRAQRKLAEAEPLCREALAMRQQALPAGHPDIAQSLNGLLHVLEMLGQHEQALPFRQMAVQDGIDRVGPEHPDVALALNQLAILLRKMARPAEAEPHLRRAIEIERRALPPDSPKHPHRLNNLSTVLVMQGKLAEARSLAAEAWSLKAGHHDLTSARILFVRLSIALLEAEAASPYLGQLKTVLAGESLEGAGNVTTKWDIESFLASLQPRLSPGDAELLDALATALNDRTKVADLDRHPAWSREPSLPLDTEWLSA